MLTGDTLAFPVNQMGQTVWGKLCGVCGLSCVGEPRLRRPRANPAPHEAAAAGESDGVFCATGAWMTILLSEHMLDS